MLHIELLLTLIVATATRGQAGSLVVEVLCGLAMFYNVTLHHNDIAIQIRGKAL